MRSETPPPPLFVPQNLPSRPRRNRRSETTRRAISETHISPANLILPVFVHDGEKNLPITSMPGVDRLGWRHGLIESVAEARSYGINQVVLFPKVSSTPNFYTLTVYFIIRRWFQSVIILEKQTGRKYTMNWIEM